MPRKRRLLIIDNNLLSHETWKIEMGNHFHLESALSLDDARYTIEQQPSFALIAIEAFEDGSILRAVPFIQHLLRTYTKPIIGVAPDYPRQLQMIKAGCNVYAERRNLPDKIFETLKLNGWKTNLSRP